MKKILISLIFTLLPFSGAYAQDNATATHKKIISINVSGVLTSGTASFIESAVKSATSQDAVLLVTLNTPGGVLDATRDIVTHLLSSATPVVVYVGPSGARAASAGMFVTLAANYALMAEGTNIGAAHPVSSTGSDIEGEMAKKVTNDTLALVRSIAEKRGRNSVEAEKMVTESVSFTAPEALKLNLIDGVVANQSDLNTMLSNKYANGGTVDIVPFEMTFLQKVFSFLSSPDVLAALLFLGIGLIGLEFKLPGSFIFGAIGAICIIFFAIGANIIPINYIAFILIILGIALLIAEIFITSFGLLTIGGIISLLFGLRMLFDGDENMGIAVSPLLTGVIIGTFVLLALLIGRLLMKDFRRTPKSGPETMYGKRAKVIEWKGHEGRVTIYGEIWNAESSDEPAIGDSVTVESVHDLMLRVKKR